MVMIVMMMIHGDDRQADCVGCLCLWLLWMMHGDDCDDDDCHDDDAW